MIPYSAQSGLLPEAEERRRILERAGTVLSDARCLLEDLDRSGGKLNRQEPQHERGAGTFSLLIRQRPEFYQPRV